MNSSVLSNIVQQSFISSLKSNWRLARHYVCYEMIRINATSHKPSYSALLRRLRSFTLLSGPYLIIFCRKGTIICEATWSWAQKFSSSPFGNCTFPLSNKTRHSFREAIFFFYGERLVLVRPLGPPRAARAFRNVSRSKCIYAGKCGDLDVGV
jgi:hypothetical protein